MLIYSILKHLVIPIFIVACSASDTIDVETSLGVIKGTTLTSRLGVPFYAFRGIRYAAPPLGKLRFRNPEPVPPWHPMVFDATTDGPMCPQYTQNVTDASEDCLRLNIYTKDLAGSKPVIVYLHPGGFYSISGQSKNFAGPQNLMDRDVVFVTMNYRLGTLGFLATDTPGAPGNAGLKDQVMALRWIQAHIRKFGGNPDSVTLFGYSAGSLSIGLHMLSPMSKGLFHRGIAMSASPLGPWKYRNNGMDLAIRQAKLFNCNVEPVIAQNLENCLREKPMLDYIETVASMFDFQWNPILNWMPVIETDHGQERFLIEDPYKTILRGDFYKVPLITGITKYEFISMAYNMLFNETTRNGFNDDFNKYAPMAFLYERDTLRSKEISNILRWAYLKNKTLRFPESLESFGELLSDSVIGFEYHRFLDLVSRHVPVYTYQFKYKGRYSHFQYPANHTYGAVHHDELLYLLYVPVMTPLFKETDPENEIIERLTRMWTEFALKNDPNNHEDMYLKNISWDLYSITKKGYLEIDKNVIMKPGGFYQERYKLWDELFPIPYSNNTRNNAASIVLILFLNVILFSIYKI